ncbi:Programmed cell death protein 6 [Coelomomyces lativittatus]|nr:Programmed cell death protein 6 [Coelomomyces lativittatus]
MVSMFDDDGNGTIEIEEFISLFRYIGAIRGSFDFYDTAKRDKLDLQGVSQAIARANFQLSPTTLQSLFEKFDKHRLGFLNFSQYMELAMYLGNLRCTFDRYTRIERVTLLPSLVTQPHLPEVFAIQTATDLRLSVRRIQPTRSPVDSDYWQWGR